MKSQLKITIVITITFSLGLWALSAHGAEKVKKETATQSEAKMSAPAGKDAPAVDPNAAEEVDVDKIKEKYWARGDATELGVVQNRTYSKARKIEISPFGGIISSDPFLSVKTAGGSVGFHFSEYFSAHLLAWKAYVSPSNALVVLRTGTKEANTNPPSSYVGAEGSGSILYGKLSLVGAKIIYYDMHLLGGAGMTNTESGKYLTPHVGIGQNIYLNRFTSLKLDYRLMAYKEEIFEKQITQKLGQSQGFRTNYTHSVTLGVTFLWDAFGK